MDYITSQTTGRQVSANHRINYNGPSNLVLLCPKNKILETIPIQISYFEYSQRYDPWLVRVRIASTIQAIPSMIDWSTRVTHPISLHFILLLDCHNGLN